MQNPKFIIHKKCGSVLLYVFSDKTNMIEIKSEELMWPNGAHALYEDPIICENCGRVKKMEEAALINTLESDWQPREYQKDVNKYNKYYEMTQVIDYVGSLSATDVLKIQKQLGIDLDRKLLDDIKRVYSACEHTKPK